LNRALGRVRLPLHLNWSQPDREFDLSHRRQRARVYEIVLREGTGHDILDYIDGTLLVDLWPDPSGPSSWHLLQLAPEWSAPSLSAPSLA
jgi:hypothetical protein